MSNPVLFHQDRLDARIVVHGDDFVTLGDDDAHRERAHVMSRHYTIKLRAILGAVAATPRKCDF